MVELVLSTLTGVVIAVAMVVLILRRQKREARSAEQLRLAVAEGQQVPLSLHPVIDATLCVGSFSCIKACPEGEIIGVVDGVATLVEAAHCIGHARCAVECPVGAIRLVFGTAERGIDLPEASESFESSRPGVFIIGELGGMGLIKNALRQGLVLAKELRSRLKKGEPEPGVVDVIVVGAGPAGIACAVGCKEQGLSVRVLEQDSLGGAVAHYPRGKVVMTEQIVMPKYGPFGRALLSKEDLLEEMRTVCKNNQLKIEEGNKVEKIDGAAPHFVVTTARGTRVSGRAVVLAIGLRGTPAKLNVPGEELQKVTYRLIEPEQYHGQRVLVVGGGDSAVEAAIQLAEESTAKVSISYRQTAFSRCKPRNRDKIEQLIADGRIRALLGTKITSIEENIVRLEAANDDGKGKLAPVKQEPPEPSRRAAPARDVEQTVLHDPSARDAPAPAPVDEHRSAVTGRWGARPIEVVGEDFPPPPNFDESRRSEVKKRAPSGVSMSRSSAGARPRTGEAARPAAPSVADKIKSGVRIMIGGRAQSIEELDDGTGDFSARVPVRENSGMSIAKNPKKAGEARLKNDRVIISIGGQLPTAFLQSIQVSTRRYMGDERSMSGVRPGAAPTKRQVEARQRRRLAMTLFALGGAIIAGLLIIGKEYYWLPLDERASSPLHGLLKPSGLWGHGVGVAATTFMIANFLYALRKRWRRLKGTASIRTWLTFHMFVGIMSPLVIAFHAAFLVNNLLAVWTWIALSVVVATGIFGRFLFSLVPATAGKMLAVSELREQVNDVNAVLAPKLAESKNFAEATRIFNIANMAPPTGTLVKAVLRENTQRRNLQKEIEGARGLFKDDATFAVFQESLQKVARAKLQISFYATLKRLFRAWLVVHVVVSIFMVVLIGAHVAVTTYLGFTWIFGNSGH